VISAPARLQVPTPEIVASALETESNSAMQSEQQLMKSDLHCEVEGWRDRLGAA